MINYFFFIAREVREIMAQLGFHEFDQLVGRSDMLEAQKEVNHRKAKNVDLSQILHQIPVRQERFNLLHPTTKSRTEKTIGLSINCFGRESN